MRPFFFIIFIAPLFTIAQNKKSALSIEIGLNKSYANLHYKPNSYNMFKNPFDPSYLGAYQMKSNHTGYFISIQYKSSFKKLHYITGLRFTNKRFDFIQNQFLDTVIGTIFFGYNYSYIEVPLLIRFYNKQSDNTGISFYAGISVNYLLKRIWGNSNSYYWSSFDNPLQSNIIPLVNGPSYAVNHIIDKPKIAFALYAEYRNDFYLGKNNALTLGYTKDLMPAMQQQYRMSINHRIYEAVYYPVFGYAYMAYKYQLSVPKFLKKK